MLHVERQSDSFKYVFGPVPSRRLGRSLGVDLVPRKVCSFNCVYCQVGRTTHLTTERAETAPVEEMVGEIRRKLQAGPAPDYITLSGSGEPTLNLDIGRIIDQVKEFCDVPVAVLTNGSLFWDPAVRRACLRADVVLPSLDAGDEETFQKINRPVAGLSLARVVEGLVAFRREYPGPIWLEVFLVAGLNDSPEAVSRIAAAAERIRPDRIQLNTAVRPTAEPNVKAVTAHALAALCDVFRPRAEVIADFRGPRDQGAGRARSAEVLDMICRRPVTIQDVAAGLGIPDSEAAEYVSDLLAGGRIVREQRGEREFYRAAQAER